MASKQEIAHKMGSTMGEHVGGAHGKYQMQHDGGKEPHVIMGTTINSKKGMKYALVGAAKGSLAQKPKMAHAGGMEKTRGERAFEADEKGKFSGNYTQHGKGKDN